MERQARQTGVKGGVGTEAVGAKKEFLYLSAADTSVYSLLCLGSQTPGGPLLNSVWDCPQQRLFSDC